MAFPTIPTTAAGRVLSNTQADNNGLRTFPSLSGLTKNSGDLLIAICVVYQSTAASGAVFSSWGGGFTEFADWGGGGSTMSVGAAYKVSTGSETGTFTVTQAANVFGHAAMFLLSIPGGSQTLAPEAGTPSLATTSAANIPSLNPSTWGTLDTLWIAVGGAGEAATTGSFTGLTAAPTNYTSYVDTGISSDVAGGVEAAVAFRQLNAASEDPGAFTVDTSNARNLSILFAVAPGPTSVTITHAQETNSPQQVTGSTITASLTAVTETDLAGTIVALQPLPAAETDSIQPISTQSGYVITTATTTASAQALDLDKTVSITLAPETDVALSFGGQVLTFAAETDTAQTLSYGTYSLTLVTETDLAGDVVEFQPLPALVSETAQTLIVTQSGLSLTPVTETAAAQVVSYTQGGGYVLGPATETDLANTIVSLQPLPATSTASAQALEVVYGGKNIAFASEADSALSIAPGAGVNLPTWEATLPFPYNFVPAVGDVSTAVPLSVTGGIGPNKSITSATETDEARAISGVRQMTIVLVTETSTAQALTKIKSRGITTATSTASALSLSYTQAGGVFYLIDPAVDTSAAVSLSITKTVFKTLGIASEIDLARPARAANRPTGGLVLTDHELTSDLALTDHTETESLAFIDI